MIWLSSYNFITKRIPTRVLCRYVWKKWIDVNNRFKGRSTIIINTLTVSLTYRIERKTFCFLQPILRLRSVTLAIFQVDINVHNRYSIKRVKKYYSCDFWEKIELDTKSLRFIPAERGVKKHGLSSFLRQKWMVQQLFWLRILIHHLRNSFFFFCSYRKFNHENLNGFKLN